jgi:hypothetical protein
MFLIGGEELGAPRVRPPVCVSTLFAFALEHTAVFSSNRSSLLARLLHNVENLFFTALSVLLEANKTFTCQISCFTYLTLITFHLTA